MNSKLLAILIALTSTLYTFADVKFQTGPTATKTKNGTEIKFSVSETTDIDLAIINASGKVVRHLAAGMLGKNPPAPLKPDSLKQTIIWDGKDDSGKVVTEKCTVRVRLGLHGSAEKYVGWNAYTLDNMIEGLGVNKKGELFVIGTENFWGRSTISVFSREGKYLRTILPRPGDTPPDRLKGLGHYTIDGKKVPVVINSQSGATQPLTSALRQQEIAIHPDGHLLLHSATGSLSNHGPAQHIIAIDPYGGVPEKTGYIGPLVRKVYGFIGGAGNRDATPFQGLALSTDGTLMYQTGYTGAYVYKKTRGHAVFRMKWSDKDHGDPFLGQMKPGSDDQHFTNPLGVATDSKDNIYVCDYGNNRIMIFNSDGKLLRKMTVASPYQVKVHKKTGDFYVLSRAHGNPAKGNHNSKIIKYPSLSKNSTNELFHIASDKRRFLHFALDQESTPTQLWVAEASGWRQPTKLFSIIDKDGAFIKNEQITNEDGLRLPTFVSALNNKDELFVQTLVNGPKRVAFDSSKPKRLKLRQVNEIVVAPDDNIYTTGGWAMTIRRHTPDLKPYNFPTGGKKGQIGPWVMSVTDKGKKILARAKGVGQGGRGYCFGPKGNLYVIKMPQYSHGQVDIYSPDGELIKEKIIENIPYGSGGITVDNDGNIYVGVNLRPLTGTDFYPKGFEEAPTDRWVWYKTERPAPWNLVYFNTYLYHSGQIMKFSPKGGKFYIWNTRKSQPKPIDMPAGLLTYRSGYLSENIAVEGSQWLHRGCSPIPTSGESWGDPSCSCWNVRISSDKFNRIFAPDALSFSVKILDSEGNHITSLGHYDNCDNQEVSTADKVVDPAFAWPCYVDVKNGRLFVSDSNNNRVAIVKLIFADTKTCEIK